jgi:hypothetical protein
MELELKFQKPVELEWNWNSSHWNWNVIGIEGN